MIVQKISKEGIPFENAKKYYSILFIINGLDVTEKEISLVSFMAVQGTISTPLTRDRFISEFDSSRSSIYNMCSKLRRMAILVKNANKVTVNSVILPNFDEDILLQIKLVTNGAA